MERGIRPSLGRWLSVCSLLILFAPGIAAAAPLTLTLEATIGLSTAGTIVDPAGMDGATVSFTATFADGTTWVDDGFAEPAIVASSHSFTITGASVAASNGTYSDPTGFSIVYFLGFEALFTSVPLVDLDFPEVALGSGHLFRLGFSLDPVAAAFEPSIGDFVEASQFASTFTGFSSLHDTLASVGGVGASVNTYGITTVVSAPATTGGPTGTTAGVPSIPEPATLAIFAFGLAGLGVMRRRRKKPAA